MADLPPWMSSAASRRARNASSARQEAKHAKTVQGRVQAGSGSSYRSPGDVRSEHYLDELKETDARSFSITATIIRKITRAAEKYGKEPRLIVDLKSIDVRAVVTFEDIP